MVTSRNDDKSVAMRVVQFVMIALFVFDAIAATAVETELHAEQWELSRSGERLLGIEGLAKVVTEWSSAGGQQIELQYPGGEEGEIWVSQLMDWLVALGIPSANLVAVPGSGQGDMIRLRVIRSGEKFR
jgi:hypothetical protein